MLKTSTGRIYTLLSACKPENAKVKKRLLITTILEMPEYKALQVYQGAASAMDDHYGPSRLQAASYEQLEQIAQIIPFLEDCIHKLYALICYGDIRALYSLNKIRFYDAESMRALYEVVKSAKQTGVNITNIPEYDVWSLFSSDTIKSIDKCWDLFENCDIDYLEIEIANKLQKGLYCISAAEIAEKRRGYLSVYQKEETARLRLQIVENKIFMKKLLISLFTTVIFMTQFTNSSVALHPAVRGLFLVLYIIALVAYWIMG